ncbi:hypothetical protein [Desulfosarcina variabilis]|uniref:hypothetical protein n=1 Tax=Desulfosarcina variabilis TaxID=2300 RepID=UPI003AFADAA5
MNNRLLTVDESNRLDFAVLLIEYIATGDRETLTPIIDQFREENGISRSLCYKVKQRLQELNLIRKERDPFSHRMVYIVNMNRYERDLRALYGFKSQVKVWKRSF